ncbi:MAG: AAA family ATPase, partial [Chloroflexi bacterium]|nr:AAA family ATPase [Chloroflexota bacterium]
DRSRLTQAGMMVGTVSYMPPEQAMGGETTPKADLYSLGAMLYEMVTGRPPFLGDDSVAIIGQHINTPPVAPTWHRSDCPKPLEALILRLLAKDPSERPESAADVLTALKAIDLTPIDKGGDGTVEETNVLDSLAGGVFVGRQAEMGQLKAALEDALGGKGRMVMLVGEPGIGKTRTAQELATYAGLRGCQVLWGRCYEEQGVPPYWPWVQAMRSYVRDTDPDQLRSEMGSGAADIAEIVSDIKTKLPDLDATPQLDSPEQARFRLFDSITAFLKTASQRKPIMLVLDDLHWSDTPSLMLLQFIAREFASSRLLLIGTYRDVELNRQHPLAETLAELTRERLFERVLLRGLSQQDVRRFIEVTSGIAPPATLVSAVHTQTEGNPLFVTEVVRLMVQEGELTPEQMKERDSWEIRVPEGVREVIGRRLNRLSERCNETLTVAAVVGREFTLQQLDRLIDDLNQDMVLDVLEEALTSRLIEELPNAMGQYQFTHALMQETLVDELSLTRRVRLHARIAETLEALYGEDAEAHAAELAHHFVQAEAVLGTDRLIKYSKAAGDRAIAANAYEDALDYFQKALDAKGLEKIDVEAANMLFGLGRAKAAAMERYRLTEVFELLKSSFNFYVDVGDVRNAVSVAEFSHSTGLIRMMKDLIARGLSLAPDNSHAAGRLLCNYGFSLALNSEPYEAARKAFDAALRIAEREKDDQLKLRISSNEANVEGFYFRPDRAIEIGKQAIGLSQHFDDPISELRALRWTSYSYLSVGSAEEARKMAEEMLPTAKKLNDKRWLAFAYHNNQCIGNMLGNWADSFSYCDAGIELMPSDAFLLGTRALMEYQLGNFSQARSFMEAHLREFQQIITDEPVRIANTVPSTVLVLAHAARLDYKGKYLDEAKADATSSADWIQPELPVSFVTRNIGLAYIASMTQDKWAAQGPRDVLSPFKGYAEYSSGITIDRVLGLLAQTMGNLDDAQTHFQDALAFCRKAGYRPELAWSLCDYADMLLDPSNSVRPELVEGQHGSTGSPRTDENRTKAVAMLDESLAISTELGMRPLMERVLSRREILKA